MHKELEVMKPRCKGLWKKCSALIAGMYFRVLSITPLIAKAADKKSDTTDTGVSDVTDGIDVIKDLVLGCVGGVGVIFLAWGLLDFGTAYAAHETTQQSQAIKKVIGGSGNFEVTGCFVRKGKESCKGGDDSGIMGFRYRIF